MKQPWKSWYLWLWGAEACALTFLWFIQPIEWWILTFSVVFLATELPGIYLERLGLMPLTEAIRHYVPRWVAFPGLYIIVGGALARTESFAHKWSVALLFGMLGWLTAHFDSRFDRPAS